MIDVDKLNKMASALRILSADAVENAKSGHPGMPLGMADVMAVLYRYFINFSISNPMWVNRDRFILSAGHGSMLLYSTLYLLGSDKITLDSIKNFRQIDSIAYGHPEIYQEAGIEVTTGPLGHGVAMAVGKAIASKKSSNMFPNLINNKIYVMLGDGCLMEGISYEAIALAGTLNLNNLILIWDNNNVTIDGAVDLTSIENQKARFEANGFLVIEIDGHNYEEIYDSLLTAQNAQTPVLISAKTKIGFGSPTKEGSSSIHGSPLGEEELKGLRKNLNWEYPPFVIPQEVLSFWREATERSENYYNEWQKECKSSQKKEKFSNFFNKKYNLNALEEDITALAMQIILEKPQKATRLHSLEVLEILVKNIPNLMGGSADLSASVLTKTSYSSNFSATNYCGNYINYGVREHAMGAIINGLAAYGGFVPYGGTFLVFSDFLRPAIRLAALQKIQSIFVFTHDSIGLGEDGPTHQPIEHIASLRLIPNLDVIRPCDGIETLEAWKIAIKNTNKPTALILSRQNLPTLRSGFNFSNNLTSLGGYVLSINKNDSLTKCDTFSSLEDINLKNIQVNLISSGSEVSLAEEISISLGKHKISSKVISMPSLNLFKKNTKEYIKKIIGNVKLNVIIKAGKIEGYYDILSNYAVLECGINDFGKSGKAKDVYDYFELTTEKIVQKILTRLNNND